MMLNEKIVFILTEKMNELETYFFSVYQNSLSDLAFFTIFLTLIFIGQHINANRKIRAARQSIPLSIGGWGTRGKSGTERLKTALINALGYSIVSKTTGCEAMFLYSHAFGKVYEMPLFRPYEKATIWEQANVMLHAQRHDADVFLWECMALRPSYVSLMQRQWVFDDIATITNTFSDHEDLQGPAGINIPEVMTGFIPKNKLLITTEEEMLPILSEASAHLNTEVTPVGWLEAGLIPEDVQKLFPYAEHPANIALVLAMADKLGVSHDYALREMANRIVPDLGVLKAYPESLIGSKKILFINGMSANERFATLGNWQRMGLDQIASGNQANELVSVLVNNRADRVARSQVFASIVVNDIYFDKLFLIGSNVKGFLGYIETAWAKYAEILTLFQDDETGASAAEVLTAFTEKYRLCHSSRAVTDKLHTMLTGVGIADTQEVMHLMQDMSLKDALSKLSDTITFPGEVNEILQINEAHQEQLKDYQALKAKLKDIRKAEHSSLNQLLRAYLFKWFEKKIITIDNPNALGEEIIERIVENTPPGCKHHIMGMQNIKGAGLGYVYCWQDWHACYQLCETIKLAGERIAEDDLNALANFEGFNILADSYVRKLIETLKESAASQTESMQVDIQKIIKTLDTQKAQRRNRSTVKVQSYKHKFISFFTQIAESIIEINRGVERRKKSDQIYKDLMLERISIQRAITELQALYHAQSKH